MQVDEAIRSLRASRRSTLAPIGDDVVRRWVEAARWCGSSKNSQPWRFVAVRERGVMHTLSTLGDSASHLAQSDLAVVLVATQGAYPFSLAFDLGRVAQCLMLLAHDDGVGSCVAVFGPRSNVVAAGNLVGIPPAWSAELAIGFGYPTRARPGAAADPPPVSPAGRLAAAELLHWEKFSEAGADAVR